MRRFGQLAVAVLALLATGIIAAGSLWLGGYDPLVAGAAMFQGSFGSGTAILSVTMVRAVPLIVTGLAVALAFRAGVWNIGAEGQLYVGAIAAAWVSLSWGSAPGWFLAPAALAAALLAGAAWAAVPAFMKVRLGIGEVIPTILMNFVGIYLAAFVVHGPLQENRGVFPQTDPISDAARLSVLVEGTRLHAGFLIALLVGLILWAGLRWTHFGFQVRSVGASPDAARVSGMIESKRVLLVVFLSSGAIAGLAGGIEITGVTFALYEGLSPGWGYTAIAVALLAGLHPAWVVFTGLLFGGLEAGAGAMQREAGVPAAWVSAVEALVILFVLAGDQIRRRFGA